MLIVMVISNLRVHIEDFLLQVVRSRLRAQWWLPTVLIVTIVQGTRGQCPWMENPDLQATCVCAFNLARQLSVQCDQV